MTAGRWRDTLLAVVGLVLLAAAGWRAAAVLDASSNWSAAAAADALPLYLTTQVVAAGGDPTDPAALEAAYRAQGVQTHALMFSTLYPASVPALLQPLADRPWPDFLQAIRRLSLGGWVLGLALAGAGSAGPGRRILGAGIGALFSVVGQPLMTAALGLGQVNLLVGGLLGGVVGGLAWGRPGLAAACAVAGAAIKLVPGLAIWPLVAGRRWSALAVGVGIGALICGVTFLAVDSATAVGGVLRTVRFQGTVAPGWAAIEIYPRAVHMLAAGARHGPLGWLTLVATGVACASAPRPVVLAGAAAAGMAWLGADAAGVGVYYALLATPAAVWLLVSPLSAGRPRWTWLLLPLSAGFVVMAPAQLTSLEAELDMLLAGFAVWAGCMLTLALDARPDVGRVGRVAVGLIALAALSVAGWRTVMLTWVHPLPPPPGPGQVERHRGPELGDMDPTRAPGGIHPGQQPGGPNPHGGPPPQGATGPATVPARPAAEPPPATPPPSDDDPP